MLRRSSFLLAFAVACVVPIGLNAQKPALADVLKAAADYLVAYSEKVSAVGADEEYTQYDTKVATATKRFQSEFVLVGLADGQLTSFRDVYAIDSNSLRPRDGRLLKLFEKPPTPSVLDEAAAITEAPLTYYINTNLRSLDMPALPLDYLRAPNQAKSTFTLDSVKNQDGVQVAIVKFKVNDNTGLLPTPPDAKTSGRFWIEVGTGAVRQSELSVSGAAFMFRVTAKYARDGALDLWLPVELFQQCEISGAMHGVPNLGAIASTDMTSSPRQSLEGRTRYSKYRRVAGPRT